MKKLLKEITTPIFLSIMSAFVLMSDVFAQGAVNLPEDPFANPESWYNPNVVWWWTAGAQWDKLITVIKNAINWVLWILGLIALIILLWWGFQMVTAAWDEEKYNAGFKILKQSGIGLAFIAFSWLFVSLIFRLIGGLSW